MESFDHTAEFLDGESPNLENLLLEDVSDFDEARRISDHCKTIIDQIARQIRRLWP